MRVRRSQIAWISLFVISSMAGVAGVMGWRRYQADPARVFSRAENAYQAGRWGEAGAALERLARLRPPTSIDRYLRAQVAVGLNSGGGRRLDRRSGSAPRPVRPQAPRWARGRARAWLRLAIDRDPLDAEGQRTLFGLDHKGLATD
jgi:hypothetical protein